MSVTLKETVGPSPSDSRTSEIIDRLLDRLKAAIAELGYDAVLEDLLSPDLIGGQDDSLLPTPDVMVVPGHLADASRPILLAVTKGWKGKDPLAFAKVMRQVKARLTEARGDVKVVVVFCDTWDSASFQEEHREELEPTPETAFAFCSCWSEFPTGCSCRFPLCSTRRRRDGAGGDAQQKSRVHFAHRPTRSSNWPLSRSRLGPGLRREGQVAGLHRVLAAM